MKLFVEIIYFFNDLIFSANIYYYIIITTTSSTYLMDRMV